MAIHESAKKRIRQNEKRRKGNKRHRSRARTAVGKFEDAVEEGNLDEAEELLKDAESALDKAVSKGVIPKNRASRKTSRLTKALNRARQEG